MVDSAVVAVYGLQVHVLLFIKKLLQPVDFFVLSIKFVFHHSTFLHLLRQWSNSLPLTSVMGLHLNEVQTVIDKV